MIQPEFALEPNGYRNEVQQMHVCHECSSVFFTNFIHILGTIKFHTYLWNYYVKKISQRKGNSDNDNKSVSGHFHASPSRNMTMRRVAAVLSFLQIACLSLELLHERISP